LGWRRSLHSFCSHRLSEAADFSPLMSVPWCHLKACVLLLDPPPQEGRKPHAHSDYVRGPINLHGHEAELDVMIEAKAKVRAVAGPPGWEACSPGAAGCVAPLQACSPRASLCGFAGASPASLPRRHSLPQHPCHRR
jgi:hypothetical protein